MHTTGSIEGSAARPGRAGRRHRRRGTLGAVGIAATLVLATVGCTEATKESGTTGASSAGGPVATYPKKVATGSPVKIGFANAENGATALPEITAGGKLAAQWINEYENGVNGHPIDLVTCATDGTPESSAACANRFVAERVVAVIDGADLGTDAKIPIMSDAGIATVGGLTLGTSQTLNPNGFFFAPPATSYPQAEVDLAAEVGAKDLTMILPDVPQVPILTDLSTKQAALNGIALHVVKFDPAAPDFAAAMAATAANGSDAISTIATDDWCTGIIRAAKAANYTGKLIMGQCISFVGELGSQAASGIYTVGPAYGPLSKPYAPPAAKAVFDQYEAAMAADGKADQVNGLAFAGYGSVVEFAGVMRTMTGDYTAASVMTAMRALAGAPNPIGQEITCNPRPSPGTSACTRGWLRFQQQPDGTAKPITDGFVEVKR
jgi:branched-chain amino acid transport system substrate-binding protein